MSQQKNRSPDMSTSLNCKLLTHQRQRVEGSNKGESY